MTDKEIDNYIRGFDEQYCNDDKAIIQLVERYPNNTEFEIVLSKVSVINILYTTRIKKEQLCELAKYISSINELDKWIEAGDIQAFNCISETPPGLNNCPVFASKYLHFHNPKKFPIYDSHSRKALVALNEEENFFGEITENKLQNYELYKECLDTYLGTKNNKWNYKKIDEFLWWYGKRL